jgi:hypothetical protein
MSSPCVKHSILIPVLFPEEEWVLWDELLTTRMQEDMESSKDILELGNVRSQCLMTMCLSIGWSDPWMSANLKLLHQETLNDLSCGLPDTPKRKSQWEICLILKW